MHELAQPLGMRSGATCPVAPEGAMGEWEGYRGQKGGTQVLVGALEEGLLAGPEPNPKNGKRQGVPLLQSLYVGLLPSCCLPFPRIHSLEQEYLVCFRGVCAMVKAKDSGISRRCQNTLRKIRSMLKWKSSNCPSVLSLCMLFVKMHICTYIYIYIQARIYIYMYIQYMDSLVTEAGVKLQGPLHAWDRHLFTSHDARGSLETRRGAPVQLRLE